MLFHTLALFTLDPVKQSSLWHCSHWMPYYSKLGEARNLLIAQRSELDVTRSQINQIYEKLAGHVPHD